MPEANASTAKEHAYLVRELIANLRIVKPAGDQQKFRSALLKNFYTELDQLSASCLLRAYEALAGVQFADAEVTAVRDHVARRLGTMQKLRRFRTVTIPGVLPPK